MHSVTKIELRSVPKLERILKNDIVKVKKFEIFSRLGKRVRSIMIFHTMAALHPTNVSNLKNFLDYQEIYVILSMYIVSLV